MSRTIYLPDNDLYRTKDDPDWTLLAKVDEGVAYEVDQTRIYKTETGYALAVASGCSCWSGDWEVDEFDTLEALLKSAFWDDRSYNPSPASIEDLRKQLNDKGYV